MTMASGFFTSLLGLSLLSLTLKRHRKDAWPALNPLDKIHIQLLKFTGLLCLAAATILCAEEYGWSHGLVYQCAWLMLSGLLLSLLLSYRPRWMPKIALSASLILMTICWL